MGAAESLALMLAGCPDTTTMGDTTAGSSGNPRTLELEGGIVVSVPSWRDLDPGGNPIEHRGVDPDVRVEYGPDDMGDNFDPVLAAALDRLRE
jgi:carboxyl-terminal processing protease